MNISRLKKLAMCMSAGLLFVASASYATQFTYIPDNLKVTLSNSAGQKDDLSVQQGGKLQAAVSNTNTFSGGFNTADAFGLASAAIADTPATTMTVLSTSEEVNSNANAYYLLNGLVSFASVTDGLLLTGGTAPYTLQDSFSAKISGTGVSIPSGNYPAGTKFSVSGPVSVTVAGKSETDTFTGTITLGKERGIYDFWGNLTGTRFIAVNVEGTLTDSAGETYKVHQELGQNDLDGITPDQITLNYTFTAQ